MPENDAEFASVKYLDRKCCLNVYILIVSRSSHLRGSLRTSEKQLIKHDFLLAMSRHLARVALTLIPRVTGPVPGLRQVFFSMRDKT